MQYFMIRRKKLRWKKDCVQLLVQSRKTTKRLKKNSRHIRKNTLYNNIDTGNTDEEIRHRVHFKKDATDNADIFVNGEYYYAAIRKVPMSANVNVARIEDNKIVKLYTDKRIEEAVFKVEILSDFKFLCVFFSRAPALCRTFVRRRWRESTILP